MVYITWMINYIKRKHKRKTIKVIEIKMVLVDFMSKI